MGLPLPAAARVVAKLRGALARAEESSLALGGGSTPMDTGT